MSIPVHHFDTKEVGLDFKRNVYNLFPDDMFFPMREPVHEDVKKYIRDEDPDMMFETMGTGDQFWVDCTYLSSFDNNGNLRLYSPDEAERHSHYYESLEDPVFLAIGVGGTTSDPFTFMFGHVSKFNLKKMDSVECNRLSTYFGYDIVCDTIEKYFEEKRDD
ncbi:MAG: hypothetical protein PHX08_07105 [Lachnospiraceae bacterium]|nr:hypothetical protein [Candidatus Methanomethylophilaceae archaeon]MDD3138722.1 hypothetical protein [Lachnospiraceae bacterium]MDY0224020.1 hypothetical protein [Candidatus Methanomethylophilaceae archaeon]